MRYCSHCGLLTTDPQAVRCPQCGTPLPPLPAPDARPAHGAPATPPPADGCCGAPGAPYFADRIHYTPAPPDHADTPLSMGGYLVTLLDFAVPVVGLVIMLVWGFGSAGSRARRELARAYLIRTLIFCAAALVLFAAAAAAVAVVLSGPSLAAAPGQLYVW